MTPVKFEKSNMIIGDLPVQKHENKILSKWYVTWRERWQILRYGYVYVIIKGETQPPILVAGDQFFRVVD